MKSKVLLTKKFLIALQGNSTIILSKNDIIFLVRIVIRQPQDQSGLRRSMRHARCADPNLVRELHALFRAIKCLQDRTDLL